MNSYLALAPAFVPRSLLLRSLGILMLLGGAFFAPINYALSDKAPDWLSEYMAVMVLFGAASSCGTVLRRVRSWTPSVLVGELWPRLCLFAGGMLTLLWLAYLLVMLLTGGLGTIAPTVGLAAAMFSLMASAGVMRRLALGVGVGLVATIVVHPVRGAVIEALQTEGATWFLLLVAIGAFVALMRLGAAPATSDDLKLPNQLWANSVDASRANKPPRIFWLPLQRMTRPAAFAAVFQHSGLQAWINDSLVVILALGMGFLTWLIGARDVAAVAVIVSAMSALLASILPIVSRGMLNNIGDFIWLAGTHESKRKLVFAMFLQLLRHPVRICLMALAASLFIHSFGTDVTLARVSVSLLLCAPGGAAVMLALSILLGQDLEAGTGLSVVIFSIVMSMTIVVSLVSAVASSALSPLAMVAVTLCGSGLVVLATASLTARWIAGRRQWLA